MHSKSQSTQRMCAMQSDGNALFEYTYLLFGFSDDMLGGKIEWAEKAYTSAIVRVYF